MLCAAILFSRNEVSPSVRHYAPLIAHKASKNESGIHSGGIKR